MISIANYNRSFPDYPKVTRDAGWIHGVWYCGTSWTRIRLHGQYPPGYLERASALFPEAKQVLHCPSGTVTGPGVTVDRVRDAVRRPAIVADAGRLPFRDGSFDLVLSDPPYTPADSRKYGCPPFPIGRMMDEAGRVLKPGGYLAMLHVSYPMFRKQDWWLRGLIAVVTGFRRATRILSIFQVRKPEENRKPLSCFMCGARAQERTWMFEDWGKLPHEEPVCGRCYASLTRSTSNRMRPGDLKRLAKAFVGLK